LGRAWLSGIGVFLQHLTRSQCSKAAVRSSNAFRSIISDSVHSCTESLAARFDSPTPKQLFRKCFSKNTRPISSSRHVLDQGHRPLTTVRPYMFVEISSQLFRKGTSFLSDYTQIYILFFGALPTLVNQRRFKLCVHFRRVLPFQR
jgi:Sec7-like guanine-nucleotide exchange factor